MDKELYLIGNAHLDPVWLWRWQEGFAEVLATFRSAIDRLKEFPELTFTSACASYYRWIEEIDPELFAEIRQMVAEGRWSITGGWWIQPDCNTPAGESFARHGLVSQRYFKEKFGIIAKTGYNVDSFGHNANLPQILKKSGMDQYVFMRPNLNENPDISTLFQWESADGSRVCTYQIPESYAMIDKFEEWIPEYARKAEEEDMNYMMFIGIGNHGGGPTIDHLDRINKVGGPTRYATVDEYFASVFRDVLPVWRNELQHHAIGCYSACTAIKQGNRKCEQNLLTAEKLCTLAKNLTGVNYPAEALKKAWENLLFNQFHDIMGGCSIKEAYEDASYLYGEIMSITEQVINVAMQKICMSIDTLQGEELPAYRVNSWQTWKTWMHEVLGTPIVVFNPHTWSVASDIEINAQAKKVTDENGQVVPFQKVRSSHVNSGDHHNTIFKAEVPALGYRVYRYFVQEESEVEVEREIIVTQHSIENSKVFVEFDTKTGDICKFYEKESGRYIIDMSCEALLLDETACDTWAHGARKLGDLSASFDSPEFTVLEQGAVRGTLRIKTWYKNSYIQRDYTLLAGSSELRVAAKIDFRERHRSLKFKFPTDGKKIIAQIPYGTIERPCDTGEEPFGMWFASGSMAVANDCKHGYDTEDGFVRMTVLRSAVYADHFADVRDEFCHYMEQGIHEFRYSVFPYTDPASAERKANELNSPLRSACTSFHKGTLPENISCFACDNSDIVVTAIKQAEDSDADVIRVCEMNAKDGDMNIKAFDKTISAKIHHNEIKTLMTDGKEVNLLEWEE